MSKLKMLPLKILGFLVATFAVTFLIYFFNLDMKMLSKIEPFLLKHYDTMPRNQSL